MMEQLERGYQDNFYGLYEKFQDEKHRQSKAAKIFYILSNFSDLPLREINCIDMGCSNGLITIEISPLFANIVGLDYDVKALHMTPFEKRQEILFLHGDAMRLPFPDYSFGAVVCSQVYEHVPSDIKLFSEIDRVLKPGGVVFFSGPNKMFPIEPHYYLPFLHMLPEKWANAYLRLLGRGTQFYERSRTPWGLRKIFSNYAIKDVSIPVMRLYSMNAGSKPIRLLYSLLLKMPIYIWKVILIFIPNFNWLLFKRGKSAERTTYEIIP